MSKPTSNLSPWLAPSEIQVPIPAHYHSAREYEARARVLKLRRNIIDSILGERRQRALLLRYESNALECLEEMKAEGLKPHQVMDIEGRLLEARALVESAQELVDQHILERRHFQAALMPLPTQPNPWQRLQAWAVRTAAGYLAILQRGGRGCLTSPTR